MGTSSLYLLRYVFSELTTHRTSHRVGFSSPVVDVILVEILATAVSAESEVLFLGVQGVAAN
jgi:hypothetical protein